MVAIFRVDESIVDGLAIAAKGQHRYVLTGEDGATRSRDFAKLRLLVKAAVTPGDRDDSHTFGCE